MMGISAATQRMRLEWCTPLYICDSLLNRPIICAAFKLCFMVIHYAYPYISWWLVIVAARALPQAMQGNE